VTWYVIFVNLYVYLTGERSLVTTNLHNFARSRKVNEFCVEVGVLRSKCLILLTAH
jgi:hypothetical protein